MDKQSSQINDFTRRDLKFLGKMKPVLISGDIGPAVIIIHEVYGFTPTLARFCRWIRDAGFRIYAPVLFGSVDASNPERITVRRILSLCVSREIYLFATGKTSPVSHGSRSSPASHIASAAGVGLAPSECVSPAISPWRWPSSRQCLHR